MFNWSGRSVFVTGATGFIGSWITEELVKRGADVTVLIKKDDPLGEGGIRFLMDKVKPVYGDIRNKDFIEQSLRGKECVFHLAALTQVLEAIASPAEAFAVNLDGTINVLEALRKSNTDSDLIFASTDKVYGEPSYLPIDESHQLSSKSPYDASKLAADRACFSYFATYGIKAAIVRCSNVYGGRDHNALRAVPDFVSAVLREENPVIRGTGEHVRDFVYITDVVSAYLAAAERMNIAKGEAFNFGTEQPTKIIDLAARIIALSGKEELKPAVMNKTAAGEILVQYLACKKAAEKLGWKPHVSLSDGLKRTIEWYSQNSWWFDVMAASMDTKNYREFYV